jgi:molybdopterin-guanine dinucleotide biosynthesis protein A
MAHTLGVLVAGGAGARLGLGMPKALARLGGETLADRAIRTLSAVCDSVAVAAPVELALPLPPGSALIRVLAPPGVAGPLAGVVAGFAACEFDHAVVLAVDLPFVSAAALRGLLAELGRYQAVIPCPGGVSQPLAAAYAASARSILAARLQAGERSLTRAVDHLHVVRLEDRALARLPGGAKGFFNVNTQSDLAEAERRIAAGETVQ